MSIIQGVVAMTKQVEVVLKRMMVGSLRYYAHEAECDNEKEDSVILNTLADHIEDSTATDDEWIEAILQVDVSD